MSGYLLGGGYMSDFTKQQPNETAAEDINNVRQLVALVKERPCINPRGTSINRACAIGYAELTVIERRLKHALERIAEMELQLAGGRVVKDFPRPMGAAPVLTANDLPKGWTVEFRGASHWELKEGTAHRGLFETEALAVQAALELSAP